MKLKKINAVLLCGGASKRMGQNKALLKIGSSTLLAFQAKRLEKIFKKVFISSKETRSNYECILDLDLSSYSSMNALRSALAFFKNEWLFILSVDMPKISKKEILKLFSILKNEKKIILKKQKRALKNKAKTKIILPRSPAHTHFLCGLYHSSLAKLCEKKLAQDEKSIKALCEFIPTIFVDFASDSPFINLNFYEDYEKYVKSFKKDKNEKTKKL